MYDYLIVGAGLFGSVFAYEARKRGKKCLVIDKRNHIGGNCYTKQIEGINVHMYGPHIFHTDKKEIWDYVNQFAEFNHFVYSPIANYHGELYNLPFNMNTFYQMWGAKTPSEARSIVDKQKLEAHGEAANLEEQAISLVGRDIYEKLIKGYTEKQWGRKCSLLPASIIRRLPVRFTFDNNYFNHPFQGIPIGGYTQIFEKMLDGTEVRLNTDYFSDHDNLNGLAEKTLCTGAIDKFYQYRFGRLQYRSLTFETETLETDNFQGVAAVNHTDDVSKFTRIIEHKHFEFGRQPKTVITKEFPVEWQENREPYYPVNDDENNDTYSHYHSLANREKNVIFGGRLGTYKYLDMHQIISAALTTSQTELNA